MNYLCEWLSYDAKSANTKPATDGYSWEGLTGAGIKNTFVKAGLSARCVDVYYIFQCRVHELCLPRLCTVPGDRLVDKNVKLCVRVTALDCCAVVARYMWSASRGELILVLASTWLTLCMCNPYLFVDPLGSYREAALLFGAVGAIHLATAGAKK